MGMRNLPLSSRAAAKDLSALTARVYDAERPFAAALDDRGTNRLYTSIQRANITVEEHSG